MVHKRRRVLAAFGVGLLSGCTSAGDGGDPSTPSETPEDPIDTEAPTPTETSGEPGLERVGHALLSTPGEYAQGSIGPEGRYGVVGTGDAFGSFLVDLEDPAEPVARHHLPATDDEGFRNGDAKFDGRDGLYYRSREPLEFDDDASDGDRGGVEIVDFGFGDGSPSDPQIIGRFESPFTHNLQPHPEEPLVYATNTDSDIEDGLEVWDVADPTSPERVGRGWPHGPLHDVVADPGRELLHCASWEGYTAMDISDPETPVELGWVRYSERADYTAIGEPGFESGHYADYDPERDLVVMGDEVTDGVPGGKHVFDIGWDGGSPSDPRPVGFTHSPNARVQNTPDDGIWTTHNHDVFSRGDRVLVVSGDYSEGVVLYDITDPRRPEPVTRYRTDDGADDVEEGSRAPWAWSAMYSPERDLVFAADRFTGAYTFRPG